MNRMNVEIRNYADGTVQAVFKDEAGAEVCSMYARHVGFGIREDGSSRVDGYEVRTELRLDDDDPVYSSTKGEAWVRTAQ